MGVLLKKPIVLSICLALSGCMNIPKLAENYQESINLPANWQQQSESMMVQDNWLAQFGDENMMQLVHQALDKNYALQAKAFQVAIKEQQLISSGAVFWPSFDVSLRSSRTKNTQTETLTTTHSLNLNLSYELDLWGKLSDADRQANLDFLAEQALFMQAKQSLVAQVATAWFKIIEAEQLLKLYQKRAANAEQNLIIIASGYEQGLNSALDVYLTRNEVNNELSRVATQQAELVKAKRILERLTGAYPAGELIVNADLPKLDSTISLGLPANLLTKKPALVASWYQLLAKDANVAYAHKQRFPALKLTGSLGNSDSELKELLSPSSLAWSLVSNITAPIFNAGKLAAEQERARLERQISEQNYLDTLFNAFSDVENALTTEQSLQQRYITTVRAQENAEAAQTLAFEQYQSGLVEYTTVLESQKRAFDAQSSVIQIKSQLLSNRINLHLALGGAFSAPSELVEAK